MNIDYIGDVTLENSCFDSIVQFFFEKADSGNMRGAGSGRYNSIRPIFTIAPLKAVCHVRRMKINFIKISIVHSRGRC